MRKKVLLIISAVIWSVLGVNIIILLIMGISGRSFRTNEITIASSSAEKEYDGSVLTYEKYEIKEGSLYSGDEIIPTFDGSVLNYGTERNLFCVRIVNKRGKDVTGEYDITYEYGDLSVTKRNVTVKLTDEEKEYDGKEYFLSGCEVTEGSLVFGDTVSVKANEGLTDIGSKRCSFTARVYDALGTDVSDNYNITSEDGTITRTAVSLTITSASAEKTYDGTPLSASDWSYEGSLIEGDVLDVKLTTSVTDMGIYLNTIGYQITNNGKDVSDCYNITLNPGRLVIDPAPLEFTSTDMDQIYNGKPLTLDASSIKLTEGSVPEGLTVTIIPSKSAVNVGSVDADFDVTIKDAEGNDLTTNFRIQKVLGTLTIKQAPITVTTGTLEKRYDGTPLTYEVYNVDTTSLAEGHTVSVDFNAAITKVGNTTNTASISIRDSLGKLVSYNYDVTANYGTLTVTPVQLSIITEGAVKAYDGTALSCCNYHITRGELVSGHYLVAEFDSSQTEVGSTTNYANFRIINGSGDDVSSCYEMTVTFGVLTVTEKQKTIYLAPKNTYIDSKTNPNTLYTPSHEITGFDSYTENGYTIEYEIDGSLTDIGTCATTLKDIVIYDKSGNNVTSQFKIVTYPGILQVYYGYTLSVTTESASKTYDGTPLTRDAYALGDDNFTIEYVLTGSQTRVGTSTNSLVVTRAYYQGEEVDIDTIRIVYDYGTLEVTRAATTITSGTKTAEDGATEVHDDTATASYLAEGDRIIITEYTTLKKSGVCENILVVKILDKNGNDVTNCYRIEYEYGTLTLL